jgi:CheY-like chemotaxis protein
VIDTGVGIPPEKLSAVFERFVQVNSSVNKKYAGSGLGLSITRKLLELMGETIQVESIEGKGTRFYFHLHLEIGKENSTPEVAIPTFDNRNLKILIADDSEDNVMLMQHYLSKMNFQVEIASDGKEAVEKFQNNKFDIVFMDIQMPIMDGYTATQTIRAYEAEHKLPRTPIMALTAYVLKEEEEKSLRAGCDMHLAKPIKKETILKIVANLKNNF